MCLRAQPFPRGLPGEDEAPSLQGHDVGVGGFYGDAQGVLPVLVPGVLVGPPFEEEAHLPGKREPAQRSVSCLQERTWARSAGACREAFRGMRQEPQEQETYPVCPRMVAWWSGPLPWASLRFTLAPFWRRNSQVTREP